MYVSDTCHLILHTVYSLGCVYMIIHIYIYIYIIRIYIYTYLATWLPSYLPTYLHTDIHTYRHGYTHIHTYVHTCIALQYITLHCITTIQYIQTLHTLHTYMVTYDHSYVMYDVYIYTYTVAYIYIYMCIAWCMWIYIYILYISTFYIHKCNIHYIHMISGSLNIQIHVFNLYEKHNMYIIHDIMLTLYIYTHKLWDICLQCMIFDRSQVICRYTQCDVPFPPD